MTEKFQESYLFKLSIFESSMYQDDKSESFEQFCDLIELFELWELATPEISNKNCIDDLKEELKTKYFQFLYA